MNATLFALMAFLFLLPEQAPGRTCARLEDLPKVINESDFVFSGKIVELHDAAEGAAAEGAIKAAKVKVSKSYKGLPPRESVYFDSKFGHCGLSLGMIEGNRVKDEEFLFFGSQISSRYFVSSPSGVERIDSILKKDLESLPSAVGSKSITTPGRTD